MPWLVVPLGVVIGIVGIGAIYQALATSRDRQRFLSPGKVVQINGKNWHYQMMGEGHPTVIVDSGTGGTHLDWQSVGLFRKFPSSIRPLAKALYSQTQFGKTFAQESAAVPVSMYQVEQTRQAKLFPNIPLVVLSAGKPDFDITQEVVDKLQELHADLANESPQGVHIVAHESGHAIHLDKPELVIKAIRQVVGEARRSSTP